MSMSMAAANLSKRTRIATKDFVATQRQCENCQQCAIALGVDVEYVAKKIYDLCEAGYANILRYYPDYSVALAKSNGKKRLAAQLSAFAPFITDQEANGDEIHVGA